jgi:hypothetical protein
MFVTIPNHSPTAEFHSHCQFSFDVRSTILRIFFHWHLQPSEGATRSVPRARNNLDSLYLSIANWIIMPTYRRLTFALPNVFIDFHPLLFLLFHSSFHKTISESPFLVRSIINHFILFFVQIDTNQNETSLQLLGPTGCHVVHHHKQHQYRNCTDNGTSMNGCFALATQL